MGAEYILPDNRSVAMDFYTRKTYTPHEHDSVVGPYYYRHNWELPTRIQQLRVSYGIYFKDAPAPLGPYLRLGVTFPRFATDTTGMPGQRKVSNLNPNHLCVGVHGILGRNYIFYDRLVLKMAVHYGITLASPFEPYLFDDYGFEKPDDYDIKNFNHKQNSRAWVSNLFGLEVGIGILL